MWQNPQVKCGKIHDFVYGIIYIDATFHVKKARKMLPVNEFQKITTAFQIAKMTQKTPISASQIVVFFYGMIDTDATYHVKKVENCCQSMSFRKSQLPFGLRK